jgi:hypothetical protein
LLDKVKNIYYEENVVMEDIVVYTMQVIAIDVVMCKLSYVTVYVVVDY